MDDSAVVKRCKAGEREAFGELVVKYQKPLYSLLYRMLSNHEDASDVMQKAFVRAFTGLKDFEHRSSFRTWLYRIAVNLVKNVYRERSVAEHVSLDSVAVHSEPQVLGTLMDNENRTMLRRAVRGLPERQRLTVVLRVQEGLTFSEIAEALECSMGTAKANYHHAVEKLKGKLADKGMNKNQENGS